MGLLGAAQGHAWRGGWGMAAGSGLSLGAGTHWPTQGGGRAGTVHRLCLLQRMGAHAGMRYPVRKRALARCGCCRVLQGRSGHKKGQGLGGGRGTSNAWSFSSETISPCDRARAIEGPIPCPQMKYNAVSPTFPYVPYMQRPGAVGFNCCQRFR